MKVIERQRLRDEGELVARCGSLTSEPHGSNVCRSSLVRTLSRAKRIVLRTDSRLKWGYPSEAVDRGRNGSPTVFDTRSSTTVQRNSEDPNEIRETLCRDVAARDCCLHHRSMRKN